MPVEEAAQELGFYCSAVNPTVYNSYDRTLFEGTLDDWGWRGPSEAQPSWYTGKVWSD